MTAQVLIVDDEALIRHSLDGALRQDGFETASAASGTEAWQRFHASRPDVVLLDMVLGDMDGLELLARMRKEAPETKVIVITAHASIEQAVSAMKMGAFDFIRKPFELEEIVATVKNATRTSTLERRLEYFTDRERRHAGGRNFVFASAAMKHLVEEARLIAQNPVPVVLVVGETGSGKQVIARLLHELSQRASGPFVELNCSAIPENLVESELFGHERGAFSDARERKLGLVEVADGGTLLLDEIGDLGPAAQAKLLTFLEQRTFRRVGATSLRHVDVRIVAATNRDLASAVVARSFREDLWYRLNAMTVRLPPLRERRDDVAPLALHFLQAAARQFGRRWRALAPETIGVLERYRWPGNVRELNAIVSRAALLHDDEILQPAHLPADLVQAALVVSALDDAATRSEAAGSARIPTLEDVEMAHIRRVLALCADNRTLAAQHLGITRQTLSRKLGGTDEPS